MGLLFALALALSLDGLFVGMSYGFRDIRLPWVSLAIIGCCTMVGMSGSLWLGTTFGRFMADGAAAVMGSIIIGIIGLWQLGQGWAEAVRRRTGEKGPTAVLRWHIKRLGVIVHVFRDPSIIDADRSGDIDTKEALLLGTALGADAFGAGFAAAMLGWTGWILVPLVTVSQVALTYFGLRMGRRFGTRFKAGWGLMLPGIILCLLAVLQW